MDTEYKFPASPGTPLLQVSPERVNQQRYDLTKSPSLDLESLSRHGRASSVQEKAAKFESLAFQGKQLERRTNDAALRRAMLGREEAENEMRRYRDEVRSLRKHVDEGAARERKVGERLETVMETYGRAKETHAHTQTLWEKEIRRARKESFKSQSVVVKLQEELKTIRSALRIAQSDLDHEKERSQKREQEAFEARYQLVGVQEELVNMTEKIKLVEQEKAALKTIAKNEEIARIAAEGQLPLPRSTQDDEFASPKKSSRSSLLPITVMSAASEEELEQLKEHLRWEKNRAERAQEHVEYMRMECEFKACSCRHPEMNDEALTNHKKQVSSEVQNDDSGDEVEGDAKPNVHDVSPRTMSVPDEIVDTTLQNSMLVPEKGVFGTPDPVEQASSPIASEKQVELSQTQHFDDNLPTPRASVYARTPSCDPPSFATIQESNLSLLSLLDDTNSASPTEDETAIQHSPSIENEVVESAPASPVHEEHQVQQSQPFQYPVNHEAPKTFRTISTTTRIPLSAPVDLTPSDNTSDLSTVFSPTMTREEALAQIRERRGRARSLAQGTLTPRKQMVEGVGLRRDISAPAVRSVARSASRGRNLVR